jgi:23S rRNA-/tRNA-specific pseudouridylate synthase
MARFINVDAQDSGEDSVFLKLVVNADGSATVKVVYEDGDVFGAGSDIVTIKPSGVTVHDGLRDEAGILRKNGSLRALVNATGLVARR